MSVPEVIPIKHEPDYRTSTIGRWSGGQFFASVTGAFSEGWTGGDWEKHRRWCAVLHRFDGAGRHLDSRIEFTGTTADGERSVVDAATRLLDAWLDALPERQYQDIAVAPFTLEYEGVRFGLVVEGRENEEGEEVPDVWVELYPDGLGFSAPWDGEYDT
ncbi:MULTISPECIES: hypothetical protein [unclassified Streptomyces]|uniref:hypothetical protein n=1 Tax=unclassified Streptomyces TaxID=2593676 RepID=UPI0006FE393B|nr:MULTISPECIES: hypothetical protein [unclassified Streptomyces]KQX57850.1 hypothetical protein ASD33_25415 [Streptomyces sp. Root1304]KRA78734.1 hypothetical protein ASE09_22970 [Streptomyces sp. Root66D1]